jgi:hypothetical protein
VANEELYDEQISREIESMAIHLTTKAMKTALTLDEYVQTRLLAGTSAKVLEKELVDDLINNGRIFSEFRRAVKATARGSVNRVRDVAYFSEFEVDKVYRWSAVLVKTCPDCLERHGQLKSWEEWEAEGLPRTGATVCRENCHCVLIPEEYAVLEPIKREKK